MAAVSALVACTTGCGTAVSQPRVILISIDALRADHLGCYGYRRDTTPALDRLASRGLLFEQASATGTWTIPSHASLLTGLYPRSHGMRTARDRLPDDIITLASNLAGLGYATGAIVNVRLLSPDRGFGRGFQDYEVVASTEDRRGEAEQINSRALDWLERHRDRPLFLFLHYYDVHSDYRSLPRYEQMFAEPYAGPASGETEQLKRFRTGEVKLNPSDARHLINLYDAGIRQLDDALGAFFEELGRRRLLESTFLIVTADHGEEFLDHGDFLHSRTLHQEVLRVPLIVSGPGLPHARRLSEPVSHVDVVPTLAALLGVAAPPGVDGLDVSPLWEPDRGRLPARAIFAEADYWAHNLDRNFRRLVRKGRYTLHYDAASNSFALYDLEADPREQHDIAAREAAIVAELSAELNRFMRSSRKAGRLPQLDPEQIRRLRQLGYVD